ncbi:hypothetical protein B7463_g3276, partial [Scytalidium lignicola]
MLSSPGFFIWANEPVPVPATTMSECYPREFLESYTSVPSFSSGSIVIPASSIVPALSPFICPEAWNTVLTEGSYIACCPIGYNLHPPTNGQSSRPAYGGTCFSDFTLSQEVQVTVYNNASVTSTINFIASTTPAQAFAHPIDGWSLALATSATNSTQSHSTSKSHTGAIVGGVIGGVALLGILLGAACLSVRRRQHQSMSARDLKVKGGTATMQDVSKDLDIKKVATGENEMPAVELYALHTTAELQENTITAELP